MKRLLLAAAAAAALFGAGATAQAAQIYTAPQGLAGNQSWTGTLGLDFKVNTAVKVSSLGVFDADGDGLSGSFSVVIFDFAGNAVTPIVSFVNSVNVGGAPYLFQSISPVVLGPGSYQLASWGFSGASLNYNNSGPGGPIQFDSLGGALTALGTRYANSGSTGSLATNVDVGLTRYGSASFNAVAVPEPATWAMMIGGFGLVGFALRRREALATA